MRRRNIKYLSHVCSFVYGGTTVLYDRQYRSDKMVLEDLLLLLDIDLSITC